MSDNANPYTGTAPFRYASSLGHRYAMPIYFDTLPEAQKHQRRADRYLDGLPGHDSMRIEVRTDGEWEPI
ncbi:Uncharacterised protein [Mycobacteroides abscessus subsp. massiliense]|nr:Uncharacterised protein [Mycobacteroides abscessus subsp. abscessus]SKU87939.1 Uncharacterised protein [Mycobacteroides abscessus subsp. massiliense]SKU95989.1 Uncharacterised protein [Mycobacteroides abscessus subsp. massiliense]